MGLEASMSRASRMGAFDVAGEYVARARQIGARRTVERIAEKALRAANTGVEQIEALYTSLLPASAPLKLAAAFRGTLRERALLPTQDLVARLAAFRECCPDAVALTEARAVRTRGHVFDLLGSGPVHLGANIDWHTDFISGHRFPRARLGTTIRAASAPGGFDIKVPWELARCQHFVWLAQGWVLTRERVFVDELGEQMRSFIRDNPWRLGVNWGCAMEVALRAVSWLATLGLVVDAVDDALLDEAATSLVIHGIFIEQNLERHKDGNSNHYLADLLGLAALGTLLPFAPPAERWRRFAFAEFARELEAQVGVDGVDYEGSLPYHLFVLEMTLLAIRCAQCAGESIGATMLARVRSMADAALALARSDGQIPRIGDLDDGRALPCGALADAAAEAGDVRRVLAVAGCVLDDEELAVAGAARFDEGVWWGASRPDAHPARPARESSFVRAFASSGVHVARVDEAHLVVTGGASGTGGLGNHSHGDALSFDLAIGPHVVFHDPGGWAYTNDHRARREYRHARAHNALIIDGRDQGLSSPEGLFDYRGKSAARIVEPWRVDGDCARIALERSDRDVRHRRTLSLRLLEPRLDRIVELVIHDELGGDGAHDIELALHSPAALVISSKSRAHFAHDSWDADVDFAGSLALIVDEHRWAKSYGRPHIGATLRARGRVSLPIELTTVVRIELHESAT
jgi:hypothetical protein